MASSLTLEVTGPEARRLGAAGRKVFTTSGGTIGRLPDNSWVLADPHISGRHAVIRYSNGTFYVVDTSSNGVFLNSPETRLQKNQPQPLKDGDRLYMDAYEIRVSIRTGAAPERAPGVDPALGDPPAMPTSGPYITDNPFDEDAAGETAAPLPVSHVVRVQTPAVPLQGAGPLHGVSPLPGSEVDPMKLLGLNAPPPSARVPRVEDLQRGSALSRPYRPPPVRIPEASVPATAATTGSGSFIPAGYNPLVDDEPVEHVDPPRGPVGVADAAGPATRSQPSAGNNAIVSTPSASVVANATTLEPTAAHAHTTSSEQVSASDQPRAVPRTNTDLAALLAAAGIEETAITPEVIESFGRILRIVVSGTMDLLRVREGVKDEFRMKMTTFKASDNNPLKFSANVEDALHNLLVKRNPAYLPAVDAFRDAFQDASNHQVAMFEGLRTAFAEMLHTFDPQVLEERFDKQLKGALLPGRRKYWELYKEWYEGVAGDADGAFRTLFGEEFARAYEQQMQRLKNSGRR